MPAKKKKPQDKSYDKNAITPQEYGGLQKAFTHLNRELFGGALPNVFITYQRKANSRGYFGADHFAERDGSQQQHEIALNPAAFVGRTDEQIVSTLLHEMVHLWQFIFGQAAVARLPRQTMGGKNGRGWSDAVRNGRSGRQDDGRAHDPLRNPRRRVPPCLRQARRDWMEAQPGGREPRGHAARKA